MYIFFLALHIRAVYLTTTKAGKEELAVPGRVALWCLGVVLLYPTVYAGTQLYKEGPRRYFKGGWNCADVVHIVGGYTNVYLQQTLQPRHLLCQSLLCCLILVMLFKLFFFFRISKRFSIVTTMILACFYDVRIFMCVFAIMLTFFGACFNVLAVSPEPEYAALNKFIRNILNCFRISFGDSLFSQLRKQTPAEDRIYWFVWVLCFILACLIFLNFIIAEVIHSYHKAKRDIEAHVYKERASMIMAVEAFLP